MYTNTNFGSIKHFGASVHKYPKFIVLEYGNNYEYFNKCLDYLIEFLRESFTNVIRRLLKYDCVPLVSNEIIPVGYPEDDGYLNETEYKLYDFHHNEIDIIISINKLSYYISGETLFLKPHSKNISLSMPYYRKMNHIVHHGVVIKYTIPKLTKAHLDYIDYLRVRG